MTEQERTELERLKAALRQVNENPVTARTRPFDPPRVQGSGAVLLAR